MNWACSVKGYVSELDVKKIVNNPKLRHDANFDPGLHFRPNLDSEKGRRKAEKANNFWEIMLRVMRRDSDGIWRFLSTATGSQWGGGP